MQIAAADAACEHLRQYLARPRRGLLNVFNCEVLASQNHGFHRRRSLQRSLLRRTIRPVHSRVLVPRAGGGETEAVRTLLLATNNPGKVREFRRLLAGTSMKIVAPEELSIGLDPTESGSSYAENALIKARAFSEAGACIALADDSGIEVDALNGAPGLRSARFGDPSLDDGGRTRLLISRLEGVPENRRTARYRAVVSVCHPDGAHREFEGVMEGRIGHEFRGGRGFGYDPVFIIADGRTSAELTDVEKDAISHRGIAVPSGC